MSQLRTLRMLSDGSHNPTTVATAEEMYTIEQRPLEPSERYTQTYGMAMYAELDPSTVDSFAEPTAPAGCPCTSTF